MMEFIKEIHEARMTRNSSDQKSLTYSDCCEKMFLILCMIEVMRYDANNNLFLQDYLRKTTSGDGYRQFRMANTDLYNFLYFVGGDNDAMDKLKDPGSAKQIRRNTQVPIMTINGYLTQVRANPTSFAIQSFNIFYQVQNSLRQQTSKYSTLRRDIGNFPKLHISKKQEVITQLLHAAQAKLRASDIIDYYSTWAGSNRLIDPTVKDTEIDISQPDLEKSPSDVSYYRLIVGNENAVRATKFVEYAAQGKATPINFIQSYLPIIQMVHDFVKAGPVAISQLKLLHKRIKKLNKK
jgi:hypothetical protein